MPLDVKIEKRVLNFTDEKKEVFVAKADRNGVIDTDKISKVIAKDTGARPAQVTMILNSLVENVMEWLEEGHVVRLGNLGSFLPSVRSQSGDTADEAGVKKVKITFFPSCELSRKVAAISINTVNDDEEESGATDTGSTDNGGYGSGDEGQDFN